jgi:hypothetical protein
MLGLKPKQPQKLAGRMVEPITCVPSAALAIPAATEAAEPLDDPPGVCATFHGLRVPRGSDAANSVVTVLPRMTAPAGKERRAHLRRHVERLDNVLDADRYAVERRQRLTGTPARGRSLRGFPRRSKIGANESADARLPELEQFERAFEELPGCLRA